LAVGVAGLASASTADAATINVTTATDTIATDGQCSLREAVIAANTDTAANGCPAGAGPDTIVLPAGTYRLTLTGAERTPSAAVNDLDVTDGLTIRGAGAATTTIDANGIDRAIENLSALTVSGITFTGGDAQTESPDGGAIFSAGTGSLTVTACAFEGNHAGDGGSGGFTGGVSGGNSGPGGVSVTGSPGTPAGDGGAIAALTPVTVTDSSFDQNSGGAGGTGGSAGGGNGGISAVQSTDNAGNGTGGGGSGGGNGGAIFAGAGASISGSVFTGNQAGVGGAGGNGRGGDGGGSFILPPPAVSGLPGIGRGGNGGVGGQGGALFVTGAPAQVSTSSFSGNASGSGGTAGAGTGGQGGVADASAAGGAGIGGGGGQSGGGGAIDARTELDLTASTFSGNHTGQGGEGGVGTGGPEFHPTEDAPGPAGPDQGGAGGIGGTGGAVELVGGGSLVNDTFSANGDGNGGAGATGVPGAGANPSASGGKGGLGGSGGAVDTFADNTTATLRNDTFAGNTFGAGGSGANGAGPGASGSGGAIERFEGLFKVAADIFSGNQAPACFNQVSAGTTENDGGNVRFPASDSSCPGTAGDPGLAALGNNGGPVLTLAPSADGSAIDAAGTTGCPATDARGAARPFGPGCDAGAYELTPPSGSTGPAQSITASGATLTATVNAHGPAGSVDFDYGTTTSYGSQTSAQNVSSGFADQAVNANVSGLAKGTVVHFRVEVTTPDGTATGADATFKVGVSGSSSGGGTGTRSSGSKRKPRLRNVSISHSRFAVSDQPTARVAAATAPLGTTFHLTLSKPASVTFAIARKSHGRLEKVGRHRTACRAGASSGGSRCIAYVAVGKLRRALGAGAAKVPFSGRIGRRPLPLGSYRVTIIATDSHHRRSAPATLNFTIIPR
jgi:CSLREA domain-containing protein